MKSPEGQKKLNKLLTENAKNFESFESQPGLIDKKHPGPGDLIGVAV